MGVQGLWQLLESTGKAISPDHLSGKVFAIDISMWFHQLSKGMRDSEGNPVHNAHLIGLFKRICKLLYYGIKPVFVFDGSVPILKRQTIAQRQQKRDQLKVNSKLVAKKLLQKLLEKHAIRNVIGVDVTEDREKKTRNSKNQDEADIFLLPSDEYPLRHEERDEDSKLDEDCSSFWEDKTLLERYGFDKEVDFDSSEFKSLPSTLKLEMLVDFKERSKNIHCNTASLPLNADDFSGYQIEQVIKSNEITERIENLRREINREAAEAEEGRPGEEVSRIYSNSDTRFVYRGKKGCSARENVFAEMFRMEERKMPEGPPRDATPYVGSSASEAPGSFYASGIKYRLDERFMVVPNVVREMELRTSSKDFFLRPKTRGDFKEAKRNDSQSKGERYISSSDDDDDDSDDFIEVKSPAPSGTSSEGHNSLLPAAAAPAVSSDTTIISRLWSRDEDSIQKYNLNIDKEIPKHSGFREMADDVKSASSMNEPVAVETTLPDVKEGREIPASQTSFPLVSVSDFVAEERSEKKTPLKNTSAERECVSIESVIGENVRTAEVVGGDNDKEAAATGEEENGEDGDENMGEILTEFMESFKDDAKEIDLEAVEAKLNEEVDELRKDLGKNERESSTITEQIQQEARELLGLFGVPYVVSPGEAEAQCAFFDGSGLVDGTITDDNDAFLFGARNVVRHLFDRHDVPELYTSEEIERKLLLSRDDLICIAMLCGCDYTIGLRDVGPVTATEIIQEFKAEGGFDCLVHFRDWWLQAKRQKRPRKETKVKSHLRRLHLFDGFPNPSVFEAYRNPAVDASTEPFTWGIPEFKQLERYALETLKWSKKQIDDMITPVAKKLESAASQRQVTDYFKSDSAQVCSLGKKLKSKRVRRVINVRKTEAKEAEKAKTAPKRKASESRCKKTTSSSKTKNFAKELVLSEEEEESSAEDFDVDDSILAAIDIEGMMRGAGGFESKRN